MPDIDDLTTVADMPVAPDQCSPGDKQRLRIHVPNVSTTLAMGAPAAGGAPRDGDATTQNYDGFSVTTEGNIYMDAKKSVTVQGLKHIDIHSQTGSYLSGVIEVGIASQTGSTFMHAGKGVVISGGVTWSGHDKIEALGEYDVEVPTWLSSTSTTSSQISSLWTQVDAAAAGINIAIAAVRGQLSFKQPGAAVAWNWVKSGIDALNVLGNEGAIDFGAGTTIHGQSGLILGTFGTMGIYSVLGTGMMSCIGVSMLAPSVSMTGIADAAVESAGETTVFGRSSLVMGSGGKVTLTSRKSEVHVLGPGIHIGGPPAEGGASQTKTAKFEVDADSVVTNTGESQTNVDTKFVVDAMDVLIGTGDKINLVAANDIVTVSDKVELTAVTEFSLMVGGGMGLNVKKNELFIGKNTVTPPNDSGKAGKGRKKKRGSTAKATAKAEWERKCEAMKAGDVGIKFKKSKIQLIVKSNKIILDGSKITTGSLVWKK